MSLHIVSIRLTKFAIGMAFCALCAAPVLADDCAPPFINEFDDPLFSAIWLVHVREVRGEDEEEGECPLYALRKAENIPANQYARIEPVSLDPAVLQFRYRDEDQYSDEDESEDFSAVLPDVHRLGLGFVAYDENGIAVLLDSRGKRIIPDVFNHISISGARDEKTSMLSLQRGYGYEEEYTYLRLRVQDKRITRRAPRWYQWPCFRYRPDLYCITEFGRKNGSNEAFTTLLRMDDLKEVIPPTKGGIEQRIFDGRAFFFAWETTDTPLPPGIRGFSFKKDGDRPYERSKIERHRLYDQAATRLPLPEFHDFYPIYRGRYSMLALYNYEDMTCRLYANAPEGGLSPVIDQPIPLLYEHGYCPGFNGNTLIAQYPDKARVFVLREPAGSGAVSAAQEGELPGVIVGIGNGWTVGYERPVLIVALKRDDKTMYRAFNQRGELISEKWFEDFNTVNNDVKHEGVWYQVLRDGSLSKEKAGRFPVSR
ncbi:MAG: hypothetical protein LBF93_01635 [Zoogloeaceae bacterium]|jgi:hypothetical protein|nr:hypothetical protein [Zoogloeaceae bacterium]